MKSNMLKLCILVIMSLICAASAFASGGTNSDGKTTAPPYGLKIQGDASGTKLEGVIEINFSNYQCNAAIDLAYGGDGLCNGGFNSAEARASIRLSTTNSNNKDLGILPEDPTTYTKKYYTYLGVVPIADPAKVQDAAITALGPSILMGFFNTTTNLYIYLKDVSQLTIAKLTHPTDPDAYEFSSLANIVLAVNNKPYPAP